MPRSCKCILDRMVHKGAMTKEERDKIVRNLKTQNEGRKTMGKLIDVDAFKARLSAGLVYQGADVLEALDEQPTIEERKTEWIPVTEKLPENEHKKYIVTLDNGEVENRWWLGCFWVESVGRVTAWMPLPKPYKEGAEDGTD